MKYFGTDGIRGVVDKTLDFNLAYKVGKSVALNIKHKNLTPKVIIGKDTRLSGDLLMHALACGLIDYGINVYTLGIVSTACVSYLSSKLDVGYGLMVTASHNTPDMNGIKVINKLGYKVTDQEESDIESYIEDLSNLPVYNKGKIIESSHYVTKYLDYVQTISPQLNGLKIAVDCAYGSNYKFAPYIYRSLGAQVVELNAQPLGDKININCGSQHTQELKYEVVKHNCDIGFAFDGDADRLVVVLNSGKELMGDELIYLLAKHMLQVNQLNSLTVVGTILTNLGCEESLNQLGIKLIRVDVGDKKVIETMRNNNYSLGGESSGHICIHQLNTTCDALINSLQLLSIIKNDIGSVSVELLPFKYYDNVTKNIIVPYEFRQAYNQNTDFINKLNNLIKNYTDIKIVVRPSGTESVIRILCEGKNAEKNKKVATAIEKFIKNYITTYTSTA